MTIQIELWALLSTLGGWLLILGGGLWTVAKVIGGQVDRRLNEKFETQGKSITLYAESAARTADELRRLEQDFLNWKGTLPVTYVLREDYIRGQVVLEAKQDTQRAEIKVVQMQLQRLIGIREGEQG
jgi:hypothetical protein